MEPSYGRKNDCAPRIKVGTEDRGGKGLQGNTEKRETASEHRGLKRYVRGLEIG